MQQGLTIELVPETAWWSNVRSNVTRAQWEKCKAYARAKTDRGNGLPTCYICGQNGIDQGWRYPVEAHEIWEYDEDECKQTLVDIWPLCPMCHKVKHLGRTRNESSPEQWARVIDHLAHVNNWSGWQVEKYVMLQFQIWRLRSQMKWALDVSFLNDVLELGLKHTYFVPEERA